MGWLNNFLNREASTGQGGNQIYWKDGDEKIVRFLFDFGEDSVIGCGQHYYNKRYYYCPAWEAIYVQEMDIGKVGCPICLSMGAAPMTRLILLAIDMTMQPGGQPLGKVGYVQQARQNFWYWIIAYQEQGNHINDKNFYIKRNGSSQETTYFISPYGPSEIDFNSINWPIEMTGQAQDWANLNEWIRQEIRSKTLSYEDLQKVVAEARAMGVIGQPQQGGIIPPQQAIIQQSPVGYQAPPSTQPQIITPQQQTQPQVAPESQPEPGLQTPSPIQPQIMPPQQQVQPQITPETQGPPPGQPVVDQGTGGPAQEDLIKW